MSIGHIVPLGDTGRDFYVPQADVPSTLPAFIESLGLTLLRGIGAVGRRLLDLLDGLHLCELKFLWSCHRHPVDG